MNDLKHIHILCIQFYSHCRVLKRQFNEHIWAYLKREYQGETLLIDTIAYFLANQFGACLGAITKSNE